jgi:zinc transport system substrate-binding protein
VRGNLITGALLDRLESKNRSHYCEGILRLAEESPMSRRRLLGLTAVVLAGALAGGCAGGDDDVSADGGSAEVTVVSAFYPLAELAGTIGGERVESVNLTPAGVEPHDLELTSDEIEDIEGADAVFYLGRGFMPALERALRRAEGDRVDLLEGLPLVRSTRDGGAGVLDPHVWLDPTLMARMATQVAETLSRVDPAGEDGYAERRAALVSELEALDAEYRDTLVDCRRNVFVTSHEAFGYLAGRYRLEEQAVSGLAPETEPDPQRIAELSDVIRRLGVPVVFAETLLPKKLADALAREADVRVEVLNPIEGLTDKELEGGADYLSTMRDNLAKLDAALDCA